MYTLIVKTSFEASHCIPGHGGKCARLHGHSYRVEAEFAGETLDAVGMLYDFSDLRKAVEALLPDHAHLNDVMEAPPTAEHIAKWVYDGLFDQGLPVSAVTVWETERYGCRYSRSKAGQAQGGS